jgi:type IV pilus assembly protein PilE
MKFTPEESMKGFTLVEVMVVLVIMAVLGAVAYPTYSGYVRKTRRIEGQVALVEAMQQEERYYSQHNRYMPFSSLLPDSQTGRFKWWSGSAAATSGYEIDAYACPGRQLTECVELRARPGTARVDASFSDAECATLTFNSAGEQASSGTLERCWP